MQAREQNEQKRLLSKNKNRASEDEGVGRGYDQHRNDAYSGQDQLSKNAYNIDGRVKGQEPNGLRAKLDDRDAQSKHLASIQSGQSRTKQTDQLQSIQNHHREPPSSYERADYMKSHMTAAQIRMDAAS